MYLVYLEENETTAMAPTVCTTESPLCPLAGATTRQTLRPLILADNQEAR